MERTGLERKLEGNSRECVNYKYPIQKVPFPPSYWREIRPRRETPPHLSSLLNPLPHPRSRRSRTRPLREKAPAQTRPLPRPRCFHIIPPLFPRPQQRRQRASRRSRRGSRPERGWNGLLERFDAVFRGLYLAGGGVEFDFEEGWAEGLVAFDWGCVGCCVDVAGVCC